MSRWTTIVGVSLLAAGVAAPARAQPVTVDSGAFTSDDLPSYDDPLTRLIDEDGREALAKGDLARAWVRFARLVRIDPDDAYALRELGRVSAAMGAYADAERALARCSKLRDGAPDPELHFLRGEALLAQGQRKRGLRQLEIAESQLAIAPSGRLSRLWRARIYALRGDAKLAVEIYAELMTDDVSSDENRDLVVLSAEAHLFANDTESAHRLLVDLLAVRDDDRASELLAWTLELRGDVDAELTVRKRLSARWDGASASSVLDYARTLERAHRYEDALARYREASDRGNEDVRPNIERLEGQLSTEVMVAGVIRDDPTGAVGGMLAGAMVPLGALRLSVVASRERFLDGDAELTTATVAGMLDVGAGLELGLGGTGWRDPLGNDRVGATSIVHTNPALPVRLYARGDYNVPWLESAAAARQGGSTSSVELQVYANPWTPKLMLVASGRTRQLTLEPTEFQSMTTTHQVFGAVGVDWIVSTDYARVARGHMMDREMSSPDDIASALVVSYRHNEVEAGDGLGNRLVLVDRSRIDEISANARHILTDDGGLALGVRAGFGYDWLRGANLWRAGFDAYLTITAKTRLTLTGDLAHETTSGLTGRRLSGYVGFHADF